MKILQFMFLIWRQWAKAFCSMFPSFLKKWSFNLYLKLLSEFTNVRSIGQLFQTIGVRYNNFFWPEHMFLKGCFSLKTEDHIFAWFWPDCVHVSWKYRGQVSLKNLKVVEQRYWLKLSCREPVNFFKVFHSNLTSII